MCPKWGKLTRIISELGTCSIFAPVAHSQNVASQGLEQLFYVQNMFVLARVAKVSKIRGKIEGATTLMSSTVLFELFTIFTYFFVICLEKFTCS